MYRGAMEPTWTSGGANQTNNTGWLIVYNSQNNLLDTSKLTVPDLTNNQFGIVMIDAERITFREIDYDNNTISGLRRGTAGTAANSHEAGALVADYSVTTYLDYDYDKAWYEQDIYNEDNIFNGKISKTNGETNCC